MIEKNDYLYPPKEVIDILIKLFNQKQFSSLVDHAQKLIRLYPNAFMIWNILGVTNKNLGKIDEASSSFRKVIKLNPKFAEGYNNLAIICQDQGKFNEAIKLFKKALLLKPNSAIYYNNIGLVFQDLGKFDQAVKAYNTSLSFNPKNAETYFYLGNTHQRQGKLTEAIEFFKKALAIKANYVEVQNNIGVAFRDSGELEQAMHAFSKALSLNKNYAQTYNNLGVVLQYQGNLKEAIKSFVKAINIKADYAEAHNNMGNALQEQNKLDQAIKAYKNSILIDPNYAEAHRNLSNLVKYKAENSQITAVKKLLKNPNLSDDDRCKFLYTFAKMKEDLGDFEAAFENYVAGGALRKKLLRYNIKQDKYLFAKIKKIAPILQNFKLHISTEVTKHFPIFILGMPRSGTTLVEQIISMHSKVQGCGELPFLHKFGASLATNFESLNTDNFMDCRNAYLNKLAKVSNGYQFVTDKMPHNFRYLGLIIKLFPEAKIIHVNRDAIATCWSNFKNYFSINGLGYSYSLHDTMEYFKLYKDLMDVWKNLYTDQIYELKYEKLISDQDRETRRLIEYISLDWEFACLSPQKNKRIVRTASQQQVKKKVYKGSSEAWRKFEPYLKIFFEDPHWL